MTLAEAEEALFAARKAEKALVIQLKSIGPVLPSSEQLLSVNLIGGIWGNDEAESHG